MVQPGFASMALMGNTVCDVSFEVIITLNIRCAFADNCWPAFLNQELVFTQGGAANFCMQKFLTGLAGLVYLVLKRVTFFPYAFLFARML